MKQCMDMVKEKKYFVNTEMSRYSEKCIKLVLTIFKKYCAFDFLKLVFSPESLRAE